MNWRICHVVKLPVLFGATGHELPSLICSTLKRTSPPAVLPRNLVWIHRHRKKGMLFVCSCRACLTQLYQFVPRKWRDGIFPSFVFCIVLSLMHSLAACLKLSPHCGTDLTRISCRWHMYTVPYISNSNVHSVYNTSDVWNWAILYGYKFIFFDCPNSLSFNILLLM